MRNRALSARLENCRRWAYLAGRDAVDAPCGAAETRNPTSGARATDCSRAAPIIGTMADRPNPIQFVQQVRAEAAKIVWPSRRETGISTVMVIVMAIFASVFFLLADQVMSRVGTLLLGVGSGTATGG